MSDVDSADTPRARLGFVAYLRAHRECVRDGVWREVVWYAWAYELKRWRCRLLGHKWGAEQHEYEYAGYDVHVGTWRDCQRKGCCAYEELWSIYGGPRGVMG